MQPGIDTVRGHGAEQVHFVCVRDSNQQICFLNAGLLQGFHRSAVAVNGHNIIALQTLLQNAGIGIDQSKVIAFRRKLTGQRGADLARSGN